MSAISVTDQFPATQPNLFLDGQLAPLNEIAFASQQTQPPLDIVLLYQDALTQEWAWEQSRRMTRQTADRTIRCSGWKMSELIEPRVFCKAVQTALRAELLILADHAGKDLPLGFYAWAESWLPYRRQQSGSLVLVVGLKSGIALPTGQIHKHLQAIACQAGMRFVVARRIQSRVSGHPHHRKTLPINL